MEVFYIIRALALTIDLNQQKSFIVSRFGKEFILPLEEGSISAADLENYQDALIADGVYSFNAEQLNTFLIEMKRALVAENFTQRVLEKRYEFDSVRITRKL